MELHVLHKHGWSISALAREFGLNWRTVKRELASPGPRQYPPRVQPTALTEAQARHVERRLAVCPGIRGTDLLLELREQYRYRGSYPAFARHLRLLRPAQVRDPEIRFETGPGWQTQADWALIGAWRLGSELVELNAMVAILGCSRAPAIRFATDRTRPTTLERLAWCLDDLGGVTREVLTDRDPAFCMGATSDGKAILAPEWVDFSARLGVVPKACRPYRAQTKGKVERMVRELKESLLPWLSGQVLPLAPTLADYDALARRWIEEVVLARRHRTTARIVGEAWAEERPLLTPIPARLLAGLAAQETPALAARGSGATGPSRRLIDLEQRRRGEQVQGRSLAEYEVAL
jgi:transposase